MIKDLDEFKTYKFAMDLGDEVWDVVSKWSYFEKDTVGKQFVRAVDSIAANLSEGFGRYHFKETKNFTYYSRGSLYESQTWLTKAFKRKLIEESLFNKLKKDLDIIGLMINSYLNTLGNKP